MRSCKGVPCVSKMPILTYNHANGVIMKNTKKNTGITTYKWQMKEYNWQRNTPHKNDCVFWKWKCIAIEVALMIFFYLKEIVTFLTELFFVFVFVFSISNIYLRNWNEIFNYLKAVSNNAPIDGSNIVIKQVP